MASQTPPLRALALVVALFSMPVPCGAGSFLAATRVSKQDVDTSLSAELADAVDRGRLAALQDALRATFASLPKNTHGNLGHKAVRYVLHRLFVQRHGWYVKGLEPNSDTQQRTVSPDASSKEWVPSYLQERLEQQENGHGTSLHELAALAAALEDLVRKEVVARLQTAYEIHELPLDGAIPREQLDRVIETYYVAFLNSNRVSATGPENMEAKKSMFAKKYSGWSEAREWLEEAVAGVRAPEQDDQFNFTVATRMALRIGEEYHAFNDLECKSLKHSLQQIEGRKPGRVRLSAFYNAGIHSHWRFTEKADYLRTLGALDESDASQAQVILPNYLMARPNCLEASDLYALCCQNECEGLMSHLEQEIGAPKASVDRVAELVAALPSATVAAPRDLSAALLGRLQQVAESNAGAVFLHSRLFAQWMHHAFPRECPYPHEAGTTTPQTPDEWMRETGHASTAASAEEMLKQVAGDTCMTSGCGGEGDAGAELPWSEAEEHLHAHADAAPALAAGGISASTVFLLAIAAALACVVALDHHSAGLLCSNHAAAAGLERAGLNLRAVLACVSLGSAACALDLLDGTIFGLGLLAGLLALVLRVSSVAGAAPGAAQYKDPKFCV